jgi:hypothetical protein
MAEQGFGELRQRRGCRDLAECMARAGSGRVPCLARQIAAGRAVESDGSAPGNKAVAIIDKTLAG